MKAYQVLCQFFLLCCIAVFPAVNGGLHQTPLVSLLANDEEDHSHQMLPNTNSFSAIPQHSIIQGRELQTHGTTTLAFVHHDRILLCIDSKASMGSYISSRNVKKIFPLGPNAVATMAGGAADCSFWIRRVAHSVKLLEERHATPFPISAKARLLSTFLKEYRGRGKSL